MLLPVVQVATAWLSIAGADAEAFFWTNCVQALAVKQTEMGQLDARCTEAFVESSASMATGKQECWVAEHMSYGTCCDEAFGVQGNPLCFFKAVTSDMKWEGRGFFHCCFPARPLCGVDSSLGPEVSRDDVDAIMASLDVAYSWQPGSRLLYHPDFPNTQLSLNAGTQMVRAGGIGYSDVELVLRLARRLAARPPRRIFVIGNAFGLSTLVLAMAFPGAAVDALDAEVDGEGNQQGSDLTRKIAAASGLDVRLTIGLSPANTTHALRGEDYGLVLVDGEHTEQQLFRDFMGIRPYLTRDAVVILHDVDNALLHLAIAAILERDHRWTYLRHEGGVFSNGLGTGIIVHREAVAAFCDMGYEPFWVSTVRYLVGAPP